MTPINIDPHEAKRRLDADAGWVYLDVRTVEEFAAGHVPGAINIPIAERNPATGDMTPNPRFLEAVRTHLRPDAPIIAGCRSGGRSARAAQLMAQSGYVNVVNLAGGFLGATDLKGCPVCQGPCTQRFPVETGDGGPGAYSALLSTIRQ